MEGPKVTEESSSAKRHKTSPEIEAPGKYTVYYVASLKKFSCLSYVVHRLESTTTTGNN